MAEITASLVSELRRETGAGLMDCKKALVEAEGDRERAKELLRIRGQTVADKKAGRAARQGVAYAWVNEKGDAGLLVEVNCETDFVARTDDFQSLVQEVVKHVANSPRFETTQFSPDPGSLLEEPFEGNGTLRDRISEAVGKIGENIQLGRVAVLNLSGCPSLVQAYMHMGGSIGVLVGAEVGSPDTLSAPRFRELIRDIALQVAATDPVALRRDEVPPDRLEKERRIFREQTLAEGKPENLVDKIVEGRLQKFFREAVLEEQTFIKEEKKRVSQIIAEAEKELGDTIVLRGFFRFQVGAE
ncbi:MAG: translation elongation factor Ts [Planctomycetales bacterium 4484_113]|nr:MAG: translation elongation factor Ts [Planctomycetales bacterium 4484_113]